MVPLPGDRRTGASAPEGSAGSAATTFGNEWFPLVRFEIGDVGRLAAEPCPCGRSLGHHAERVEGRLKSLCIAADGSLVTHGRIDRALAGSTAWSSTGWTRSRRASCAAR